MDRPRRESRHQTESRFAACLNRLLQQNRHFSDVLRQSSDVRGWELTGPNSAAPEGRLLVESECGAVAVGRTYLLPPLSFGGALLVRPWLRFHIPLIEPDMQISRIRLSD